MPTGDKADLLNVLNNNITDNNAGDVNPSKHRTASSGSITYSVNMEELSEQEVQGVVKYMQGISFSTGKITTHTAYPITAFGVDPGQVGSGKMAAFARATSPGFGGVLLIAEKSRTM